jgi:hypothetical protein
LRAAKAAHLPCQVYEGKEKKKESENDRVKRIRKLADR